VFDLSTFHIVLRYSHIVVGFVGLVVFWIPAIAKKGSRLHILSGKIFAVCGYFVGTTALIACTWALLFPQSFLISLGTPASVAARPDLIGQIRFFFAILAFLATTIVVGLTFGIAVLRTKKTPERLKAVALRAMFWVQGTVGVALTIFGLWSVGFAASGSRYVICLILGLLGIADAKDSLKFIATPRPTPMAWWYKHMEAMVGCGIGFHTAFFVFGFSRLLPEGTLAGPFQLIPWVLPSAIGIPVLTMWIRYYKRKFGELDESSARQPAAVSE